MIFFSFVKLLIFQKINIVSLKLDKSWKKSTFLMSLQITLLEA